MEDTYLVHLTATVDALYHPAGRGREEGKDSQCVNSRALYCMLIPHIHTHLRLIVNGIILHLSEGRFAYNSGSHGVVPDSDSIPRDLTKTLWTVDISTGDSTR